MPDSSNVITEIKISELDPATQANADDQLEANQSGTTRSITLDQVSTLVAASDQIAGVIDGAINPLPPADGDGSGGGTNIVATLQALVDAAAAAGGGEVTIPVSGTGIYRWTTPLQMKSNVTVRVAPGVQFDQRGIAGYAVGFIGTLSGAALFLSSNETRGSLTLSTTLDHGIASVGGLYPGLPVDRHEVWRIMGQRNAVGVDAGVWRLGEGTDGIQVTPFVEWLEIAEVVTAKSFKMAVPLEFPDYLITNAGETDPVGGARAGTVVQKITAVRNAHWIGGTFLADDTVNLSSLSYGIYAVECSVEDATVVRGIARGSGKFSMEWAQSLRCEFRRVKVQRDPSAFAYLTYHATLNDFAVKSCQDSGVVECEGEYGGQTVDLTYNSLAVCVRPYVRNCTFLRSYEGPCSHPGVYQERWENNRLLFCFNDGLLCRGLQPTIIDNVITSQNELFPAQDVLTTTLRTIIAITQANPAKVTTAANHGLHDGNAVYVTGVVGMTEVNNRWYSVTKIDGDELTININSTAFTPYASGGIIEHGDTANAIRIYAGHAKGAFVRGNKISGFRNAFIVNDGSTDEYFDTVDAMFDGNHVTDCYNGLKTEFNFNNTPYKTTSKRITYRNNFHRRMQRSVVSLSAFSAGVDVVNNTLYGDLLDAPLAPLVAEGDLAFVRAPAGDCTALTIRNNVWRHDTMATTARWASVGALSHADFNFAAFEFRTVIENNTLDPIGTGSPATFVNTPRTMPGHYADGTRRNFYGATVPTLLSTTATEYLSVNGPLAPQATETYARTVYLQRRLRIHYMRVLSLTAPGAGKSRTFTLRRSGVDTAVTVTITDTNTLGTWDGDVAVDVDVIAGGYLTIGSTSTGTPAASLAVCYIEYSFY